MGDKAIGVILGYVGVIERHDGTTGYVTTRHGAPFTLKGNLERQIKRYMIENVDIHGVVIGRKP